MDFWEMLTKLWNGAYNFLQTEVTVFGETMTFTLWEFAIGSAVFLMVIGTVVKIISGER